MAIIRLFATPYLGGIPSLTRYNLVASVNATSYSTTKAVLQCHVPPYTLWPEV